MKSIIKLYGISLFTVVTFATTIVTAQNYKAVKTDATYYFYDSTSMEIIAGRIDSIAPAGNDTLYFGMRQLRETDYSCYTPNGASWMGDIVIEKPGGIFQFIVYPFSPVDSADIFTICSETSAGEAWHFYNLHTIDHYIEAKVTQISLSTFIGISDSVKTIALQRKDTSGLDVSDPVNGQEILLSKNYGLIRSPKFDEFRSNRKIIDLCGKINPKTGTTNLLFEEVFDFQPGDELHIRYEYDSYAYFLPYDKGSAIQVILEKLPESTSEVFKYRVAECGINLHYFDYQPPDITHIQDTSIVTFSISGYNTLVYEPCEPYFIEGDFGTYLSSNKIGSSPVSQMNITGIPWKTVNASGLLWDFGDCWQGAIIDGWLPIYTYIKGLGGPYYYELGMGDRENFRKLVYYKKGSET